MVSIGRVVDPTAVDDIPARVDQAGAFQHFEMMGEEVGRQTQFLLQLTIAGVAGHQFGEDAQAVGIG